MRPPFCCSSSALLEEVVNMLRGLDEPLNDRSDGPDHCAEDCPEQDVEDDGDDVEHGGGCLLWVNGWVSAKMPWVRRLISACERSRTFPVRGCCELRASAVNSAMMSAG